MRRLERARPGRLLRFCVTCWIATVSATAAGQGLRLDVEVGPEASFTSVAARIGEYDPAPLLDTTWLSGLRGVDAPIRVRLAAEVEARRDGVADWVVGYADATRDLIVLFPSRTPSYPHDTLDSVLRHEIAHILIGRAARGRPLPRWFGEGLAVTVERPWGLTDRTRLAWTRVIDGRMSLATLDRRFGQGRVAAERAYAVSGALVRQLIQAHGADAPGRILASVAVGRSFDAALRRVTGRSLRSLELDFTVRQSVVERWLPWLTSGYTLWTGVTLLALLAIWTHQRRRRARRQQWEAEEAALWGEPEERDPWVH